LIEKFRLNITAFRGFQIMGVVDAPSVKQSLMIFKDYAGFEKRTPKEEDFYVK
jgi:hypothetical protein